jgi:hypothetical protein
MSEKLPYEEQLDHAWDDLPLPDENMAWKDMKRRLDEDDDEKIVVPPPRRGCGIGALLIGLLLLGGLWLLVRPEKWFKSKETETAQQTSDDSKKPKDNEENKIKNEVKVEERGNNESGNEIKKVEHIKSSGDSTELNSSIQNTSKQKTGSDINIKESDVKKITKGSEPLTIKDEVSVETKTPKTARRKTQPSTVKNNKSKDVSVTKSKENVLTNEESVSNQKKKTEVEKNLNNDGGEKKDSASGVVKSNEIKTEPTPVKDTTITKKTDTLVTKKTDPVVSNTKAAKQKEKEKKPIFFAAGIGLHQQIPVGGQEWTTYGSFSREGILSDYIPSVNFRMEKQDRWFLQSEFRYGAPQHTKQFTYDQVITIDTFTQSIITNSSVVKKTFYHQVPLTFNYYVAKNWSIGAGVQWNKFYSAVAEQDIKRRRPGTQIDSVISKGIIKVSNDSSTAFVKSWWQGVFQTQYQWKRFSIGARYSFGLQPYIKFKLPNQPLQEEKNSSLQIFLRYELWRSKKN